MLEMGPERGLMADEEPRGYSSGSESDPGDSVRLPCDSSSAFALEASAAGNLG